MAQSPPVLPAQAGDTITYRPISLLALVSLLLSALYAVLVAAGTVMAFVKAAPVLLPFWLLLMPAAGAVLSLVAQRRIRRAEGTLAGAALARWGLWVSLLFGLGYAAYYFMTGLAIQSQANAFLMDEGEDSGLFPRLQKGTPADVDSAFLLTVPYGRRVGFNTDDPKELEREFDHPGPKGEQGLLTRFREDDKVLAVGQAGREGNQVRPLGVRTWSYENGRYRVERDYRITSREMQLDLLVSVVAESDPAGGGRKWYVDWNKVSRLGSSRLTPLGKGLERLRGSGQMFLKSWALTAPAGDAKAPAPRDKTNWGSVRADTDEGPSAEKLIALARQAVPALFQKGTDRGHPMRVPEQRLCPWEDVDGHIRLTLNYAAPLNAGKAEHPDYIALGKVTIQTRERIDPEHLSGLPTWDVVSFQVERVGPSQETLMKRVMAKTKVKRRPGG